MATEAYQAATAGELPLSPAESQLIAIKKVSPDGQWSYGESYDLGGTLRKGWFPAQSALALIDAGVAPLFVPASNVLFIRTNLRGCFVRLTWLYLRN